MLSRLGTLLLAVIVTGAPVSLTVCEIVCATHASAGASGDTGAPEHSCHDRPSTGASGAMNGHGDVCGHGDELPVSSGITGDRLSPAPVLMVVMSPPILSVGIPRFAYLAAKSPPVHSASRLPLRI